jgi:hypothetical protein
MSRVSIVALLVASLVMIGARTPAVACSCASSTAADARAHADVVFRGTVVDHTVPGSSGSSMDPAVWTFQVEEVFKGDAASRQGLVSAVDGASCGLEVRLGVDYVVFAHRERRPFEPELEGAELYASLCDGTRPATEVAAGELGPGVPPASGTEDVVDVRRPTSRLALGAIGAVGAAGVAALVVLRRRRPMP